MEQTEPGWLWCGLGRLWVSAFSFLLPLSAFYFQRFSFSPSVFFPEQLETTIRRLDERCRVVKCQGASETIEFSVPLVDARFLRGYTPAMSTVTEVKVATERLSAQDRWELYRWLGESEDVRRFRHEELRREISVGIEQSSRGDQAPLDTQAIKDEVHHRLNHKGN
jgi:hypothetical protein